MWGKKAKNSDIYALQPKTYRTNKLSGTGRLQPVVVLNFIIKHLNVFFVPGTALSAEFQQWTVSLSFSFLFIIYPNILLRPRVKNCSSELLGPRVLQPPPKIYLELWDKCSWSAEAGKLSGVSPFQRTWLGSGIPAVPSRCSGSQTAPNIQSLKLWEGRTPPSLLFWRPG